jgi:hypothetical protein
MVYVLVPPSLHLDRSILEQQQQQQAELEPKVLRKVDCAACLVLIYFFAQETEERPEGQLKKDTEGRS